MRPASRPGEFAAFDRGPDALLAIDRRYGSAGAIQPGGNLLVDNKPMELTGPTGILEYLKPKLERNPKKPVIIRPHELAEYGYMVDVFDELRQAKEKIGIEVKNVSIPTQREIDAFWY